MFSHILTIEEVGNDGFQDYGRWVETGTSLSISPFPALQYAKPGDRYKLFYNGNGWIGKKVERIERISTQD
jgi:hypothetical protein